jgi:RHS repeat-associated protein
MSLFILLLSQLLSNGPFVGASVAFAATKPKPVPAHTTYQSFLQLARQSAAKQKPIRWSQPTTPSPLTKQEQQWMNTPHTLPPSAEPPTMQPIKQTLSTAFLSGSPDTPPLDLTSSDHHLEVQIPAGAFDLSHASVSGGNSSTKHPSTQPTSTPTPGVTPTATPPTTGGPTVTATPTITPSPTTPATPTTPPVGISGPLMLVISEQHGQYAAEMNQLAQYQWQILDAHGHLVSGITLRHPITINYHYQISELNSLDLDATQIFLSWPDLAYADQKVHRSTAQDVVLFTNDTATETLTAKSNVIGNGPFSVSGDPQNQSPPSPNLVSVSGNSGQSSYSYPLQVAPAPDGFTPQLALDYSSGTTNERQSVTSPAGDEGDGWSLSLGAITAQVYPGGQTWYSISGVDGISDRLIPDPNHNGWFFTEHLSYLRINDLLLSNNEPCFQVWDKSGTYYQFGCTKDSLQYDYENGNVNLYAWDLDLINAPNEGQNATQKTIKVSYFQDCVPFPSSGPCPGASGSTSTIRDAGIERIEYGSGPWNGSLTIDGTVDFQYVVPASNSSQSQWVYQIYGTNYDCSNPPATTNLRCDDPINKTGGANAPLVMSTLTLWHIISYVGPDNQSNGTGGYPAYEYEFQYNDPSFYPCTDPLTQLSEYCAGDHQLIAISPFVYQSDGNYALPPVLFHYYGFTNTYSDHTQQVPGGGPYIISVTRDMLDYYYDGNTGTGAHIFYNRAYNNSHGTPYNPNTGDNRLDPLYCSLNPLGSQYDCSGSWAYPDDQAWTEQVVTQITTFSVDSSSMSQATTTYEYVLKVTKDSEPKQCPADSQNNTSCTGDNWWPEGDTDWEDFYHSQFQGFNLVDTISPAGDLTVDNYYSTDGWDTPSTYPNNVYAGDLTHQDVYQGNGSSAVHLSETINSYGGADNSGTAMPCDTAVSGPYIPCEAIVYQSTTTTYEGSNASNPPTETTSYYYDDYNPQPSQPQSSWALNLSGYHNLLEQITTGTNTNENSASATLSKIWTYTTTDSGYNQPTWYTYDVNKVAHSEIDDSASPAHKWDCTAYTYDEGSGSTTPLAGWTTTVNTYTNAGCNPPPGTYGTPMTTTYTGYDVYGNTVATVDGVGAANQSFYGSNGKPHYNGCTLSTAPSIMSGAWTAGAYTTCTNYDSTYNALPLTTTNAFGQSAQTAYAPQQGNIPISTTDANSQTTSYTYSYDHNDQIGTSTVQVSEPGDAPPSYTTQSTTNSSCPQSIPSGALTPCYEIDTNNSTYPTAITETFYDGLGRKVETRTPGPTSGQDTIQFTVYNDNNHTTFTSVPFQVTAGSGWIDPASESNEGGTLTFYDALNRVIAVQDPIFTKGAGIWCPAINADATSCMVYKLDSPQGSSTLYDTTKAIDPNNHVAETLVDAMSRTAFTQTYSGLNGNAPSANQQISYQYDALGDPTQVTTTDEQPQSGETTTSVTVTMQYDDLGRLTQLVDPDRGTHTYTYDPDGHLIGDSSSGRVLGYNYDLLGRVGCEQSGAVTSDADGSCTSPGNAIIQNTYDTDALGTQGSTDFPVGRLTKTQDTVAYPEGGSTTTTEKYQYDVRGRLITEQLKFGLPTSWNLSLPTFQLTENYTDADQPETTQTSTLSPNSTGYTFSEVYDQTLGVPTGLSSTTNTTTADLATLSYTVNALLGSINFNTSAGVGSSLATESFSYDGDLRPTEEGATWQSGSGQSGTFFDEARGYDAASNVDTVTTTISKANGQSGSYSETQNFCYNEQNELVWAGNSGTQPSPGNGTCGSGTLTNSFPGGSYATSFTYTNLGQLWQGPVNGTGSSEQYLYCNSQPHQVSDIVPAGQGYSCSNLPSSIPYAVSYDAWGNVTGRSYNNQTATLSYNKLDEMVEWQAPNTNQAWYAYDSNGDRTLERSTINGTSTTETVYAFGLEEYTYDSSGNEISSTHYYSLAGHLIGERQTSGGSSTTNMFMTDALGSVQAVISNTQNSATMLSNQVFSPYGTQLSQNGNFSQYTNKGFTGQYTDPTSGLDYYILRYYDPVAGVFLSADTKEGNAQGMNPYAYVAQNPETLTDPSGQMIDCGPGCGNGTPPPPPSHGPVPCTWQGCQNGNSGNNSPSTPQPKQVKMPACNVACQNEENAQQLAKNAAAFFSQVVEALNLLELLLSGGSKTWAALRDIIFGAALASDFKYNTAIAGILYAIPRLVEIAQDLANGFAAEANHPLGWFTVQNVENDKGNILGTFFSDSIDYMLVGAGSSLLGVTITDATDGWAAPIGEWLTIDGGSLAASVGASVLIMGSIAMGYIGRQEYILGPPEPIIRYFR